MDILTHTGISNPDRGVILIVGSEGVGKHQVGNLVVQQSLTKPYSVQVRTCEKLPLSWREQQLRPKVDLVVFMVDLTSPHSFAVALESLKHLEVTYFLGKMCFVMTKAQVLSAHMVDAETVQDLSIKYDFPVLCADLQNHEGSIAVAQQILCQLERAIPLTTTMPSLLVDATKAVNRRYPGSVETP